MLLYPGVVYWDFLGSLTPLYFITLLLCFLPIVSSTIRAIQLPRRGLRFFLSLVSVSALLCTWIFLFPGMLILSLPSLVSLGFLWAFGRTLPMQQTFVEKIARSQAPDLSEREVKYCRSVTQVWCVFFLLNAFTGLVLAGWASSTAWALYTGLIAYLLIGLLFAVEFVVRKYLFRRYGDSILDRFMERIFPRKGWSEEHC
jgi:uncharacterized membrane protein